MLAVLSGTAGGPGGALGDDEEGSEEGSDEEEEEEESESEQGSDEEEEPSSSGSDDEEQGVGERRGASGATRDPGAGSDDDDDNATDAEMFRMDKHLGAYFAALKAGAGGNAKAAAEQLEQFRLRIVVLLEIFFKKVRVRCCDALCVCARAWKGRAVWGGGDRGNGGREAEEGM